jgi:hypothetical protein
VRHAMLGDERGGVRGGGPSVGRGGAGSGGDPGADGGQPRRSLWMRRNASAPRLFGNAVSVVVEGSTDGRVLGCESSFSPRSPDLAAVALRPRRSLPLNWCMIALSVRGAHPMRPRRLHYRINPPSNSMRGNIARGSIAG